ncbi:MAG: hypothetical protein AAF363_11885 [Bacteroidota bacterium]
MNRLLQSPTLTTWLSFFVKISIFILIIPLVVNRLPAETLNVWALFMTIITIQNLLDIGFGTTFLRAFTYANEGVGNFASNFSDVSKLDLKGDRQELLSSVFNTMIRIYFYLSVLQLFVMLIAGSMVLQHPIQLTNQSLELWMTWLIIIGTSIFSINARKYINVFLGLNHVAEQKRIDAFMNALFIGLALIGFYLSNSVLVFFLVFQSVHIFTWLIYRKSSVIQSVTARRKGLIGKLEDNVFAEIWPSAWQSLVGIICATGLTQSTGLIYAQLASASDSAVYLIYLRIVSGISTFSQAPFYSKIPVMSKLRATANTEKFVEMVVTFMQRSFWVYSLSIVFFLSFGIRILNYFGKEVQFGNENLFYILGLSFFFERYGAMHSQIVSTSNKIIWHYVNGLNFIITLALIGILYSCLDVLSFPVGLLIGNAMIFTTISAYKSHQLLKTSALKFEMNTALFPLLLLISFIFIHSNYF